MTYDLSRPLDLERFQIRSASLVKKGAVVELTEKAKRSLTQNSYLHLLIGVVALETGTDIEYAKQVYFKRLVNPAVFVVRKPDKLAGYVEILRSSADLTKEEMSTAIDRFKRWAAENGIYMPEPGDEDRLREIEIEMARQSRYL